MNKFFKICKVTILMAVTGLFGISCDFDGPSVKISGYLYVGEVLSASDSGSGFSGDYTWYSTSAGNEDRLGSGKTLTVPISCLDKNIYVKRYHDTQSKDIKSALTEPIRLRDGGPSVSISGSPYVGEPLSASTSGSGFSTSRDFTWYSVTSTGSENSVGSGPTLIVPLNCVDRSIYVQRYNDVMAGYVKSDLTDPIRLMQTVTITGIPRVGQMLTATAEGNFGNTDGFEWCYVNSPADTSYTKLSSGMTGISQEYFTIPANISSNNSMLGKYIYARRYFDATKTYVYSNRLGPVVAQQ